MDDARRLAITLQGPRSRSDWRSNVLRFESDRSIQNINPYSFTWDNPDPYLENIGWNYGFGRFRDRWQDTQNSLFRRVQHQKTEIAKRALEMQKQGHTSMDLNFPDPMLPFKEAFSQLLAPKQLLDLDPRNQQINYRVDGQDFPLTSLSSGEREVVNIVFDFILRNPSDSIVFFDEPELHLHPELSYKLLQTLRNIGQRNQFFFCTHSPEIITASLDQSVVFLAPPKGDNGNQAIVVREDDDTNQALKHLGQSVGIISLGKRLVLVEGSTASLDKQTYGAILRNRFPQLVLVPSGGKDIIRSFSTLVRKVLDRTIWGVDFFMLCDGDARLEGGAPGEMEARGNGRLRFLPRYHLENYFLDANALAAVFEDLEPAASWLRSPAAIDSELTAIATRTLPYAVSLIVSAELRRAVGNVDLMPSGCDTKTASELPTLFTETASAERNRVLKALDDTAVATLVQQRAGEMQASLSNTEAWKRVIPGRPVLHQFASKAGIESGRLKLGYLSAVERRGLTVFQEIVSLFESFAKI